MKIKQCSVFKSTGFAFLLTMLALSSVQAEVLVPGRRLPELEFQDQHDRSHRLSESLRFLIFAADMDGGKLIHTWMNGRNDDFLTGQNIALLADVHRMPFLIAKTIALPRMRRYSYSLLLIREEGQGSIYPQSPKQVTIMVLKKLDIVSIHRAETSEELEAILDRNR